MSVYHLGIATAVASFLMCPRVLLHGPRRPSLVLFFAVGAAVLAFTLPIDAA